MNKNYFEQNIKSRVGKNTHTHINILFIRVLLFNKHTKEEEYKK